MKTFLKGTLVYLPTGVKLYKLTDGEAVDRYKITPKPTNVLFVGKLDRGKWAKVLYEGEVWDIPTEDVYPISKRSEQ
tara:strand:+ start:427 stop:657 length:231 start_codon:yes stop_codon:yes gene_type:complete